MHAAIGAAAGAAYAVVALTDATTAIRAAGTRGSRALRDCESTKGGDQDGRKGNITLHFKKLRFVLLFIETIERVGKHELPGLLATKTAEQGVDRLRWTRT